MIRNVILVCEWNSSSAGQTHNYWQSIFKVNKWGFFLFAIRFWASYLCHLWQSIVLFHNRKDRFLRLKNKYPSRRIITYSRKHGPRILNAISWITQGFKMRRFGSHGAIVSFAVCYFCSVSLRHSSSWKVSLPWSQTCLALSRGTYCLVSAKLGQLSRLLAALQFLQENLTNPLKGCAPIPFLFMQLRGNYEVLFLSIEVKGPQPTLGKQFPFSMLFQQGKFEVGVL